MLICLINRNSDVAKVAMKSGEPIYSTDSTEAPPAVEDDPRRQDGMEGVFNAGDRVQIFRHGRWPDGTTGTICAYPAFAVEWCLEEPQRADEFDQLRIVRRKRIRKGIATMQFVLFDQPTDDGSGDGPYSGSEILVQYLRLIH